MINLSNGHSFSFTASSGSFGFAAQPYWWNKPFKWMGLLRSEDFVVILKTLTVNSRRGNWRWYKPWKSFRFVKGGYLNCFGLPNPGINEWFFTTAESLAARPKQKFILSLAPTCVEDINEFADYIWMYKDQADNMIAVQLNLSCPNTDEGMADVEELLQKAYGAITLPIILKLGFHQNFVQICQYFNQYIEAVELINTIPYETLFPGRQSPLRKYGYEGGVSGLPIQDYSRYALHLMKERKIKTPVISGGGIYGYAEAKHRLEMGADAISFGTIFTRSCWRPNKIIQRLKTEGIS